MSVMNDLMNEAITRLRGYQGTRVPGLFGLPVDLVKLLNKDILIFATAIVPDYNCISGRSASLVPIFAVLLLVLFLLFFVFGTVVRATSDFYGPRSTSFIILPTTGWSP